MPSADLTRANVLKYEQLYDTEKYLFNQVGKAAKERGYLKFEEFYEICMWKSSRPKKRYIKNKKKVEIVTRKAFAEHEELEKMSMLCGLDGIGIPTASAILTIVYPEKYAVIDIRCLEQLNQCGHQISTPINLKTWILYLDKIRKLSKELKVTPRQIDMALFAMHRESLMQDNFRNLY